MSDKDKDLVAVMLPRRDALAISRGENAPSFHTLKIACNKAVRPYAPSATLIAELLGDEEDALNHFRIQRNVLVPDEKLLARVLPLFTIALEIDDWEPDE